jgi:2-polyprenyl-3-methyl-5-hydroxy-6-metoxy-1,4-benzoquinol methylase
MSTNPTKFEQYDLCPACGSSQIRLKKRSTFDFHSLKMENLMITDKDYGKIWDLWQCASCTHVFANPFPSPSFVFSLYSGIEDALYDEEAEGRAHNFLPILSFLEKLHPERGPLFDVGAATGILMKIAEEKGWEPEGIEASSWSARIADEKYGLKVINGDFLTTPLDKNRYHAVTMIDFIEHVPHPMDCTQKAFEMLTPNGTLCLVTPDVRSIAAKLVGKRWWHFRPAHLGYFSFQSLANMLQSTGFRIIKVRRYSWTFSAHYILSRLPLLSLFIKNSTLASFWKKIRIKLPLQDSLEVYAVKKNSR